VYLPYMIVDGNASADVAGKGEIKTRDTRAAAATRRDLLRRRRVPGGPARGLHRRRPAAGILQQRGNLTRSQHQQHHQHDPAVRHQERGEVERVLPRGLHSEKRDLDVARLRPRLRGPAAVDRPRQVENRWAVRPRRALGTEGLDVHGTRWVSMYLPVWLYSYHQPGRNGGMLHYIAVNGRTGETMGSIPVQQWKLILTALTVGTFLEGIAIWILAN
jgi:hypothetical protein